MSDATKPSPHQLAAFTVAARERSFSRAAAALGVSQPSVTQHVAKLESLMGTRLFVRRREGLELTGAGRELFEMSDRLRTLEEIVVEKVARYGTLDAGQLTVIANAPRPTMPILARYTRRYPKVQIEFGLHRWDEAMRRLGEREADLAVVAEPTLGPQVHARPLETTRYLAVMRRDHPLAERETVALAEIARQPVILPEDGSLTQRVVRQKLGRQGLAFSQVVKTWTFPVVKEAILHGIGVGILLENSLFPSRHLVEIPIREMPEPYRNFLVTPVDKRELRLVKSFFEVAFETLRA